MPESNCSVFTRQSIIEWTLDLQTTFKANFPEYNVLEIAEKFGGVEQLRAAMLQLQTLLYSA